MIISEIENKEIWESFLAGCQEKTFLQSWHWGEFQKMMGNKIWRLGIYENEELISVALAVEVSARRGRFLLVQHGPNVKAQSEKLKEDKPSFRPFADARELKEDKLSFRPFAIARERKAQILELLLNELKKIGKEEKCDFIRVAPLWERSEENIEIFRKLGFKEAPMHASAYEATWKLDIAPSEEELLKNMRKTTRYLIRQAQQNNNIEIFQRWSADDVDVFNKIHQEVVKAQKFTPFSLEHFKNEFLAFQKDDQIRLFFGKYKGKIIASAFVLFWSDTGFYHHAALLPQYHKVPVSYLLLWEAIKEAKKRRCVLFDFWGFVDPKKQPEHPWAGPTLFKMGFGGVSYQYVATQDFPLSKKYWLTFILEKIRKIKRGL